MILTIRSKDNKRVVSLPLTEDSLPTKYTSDVNHEMNGVGRTHPAIALWNGGQLADLPVTIKLIAGAYGDTPGDLETTRIDTAEQLITVVQTLVDFSLPPNPQQQAESRQIETVTVSIGGARPWFQQSAILKEVGVTWKPPYRVDTGLPMCADLELLFLFHFAVSTGKGVSYTDDAMPHRPFKFGQY